MPLLALTWAPRAESGSNRSLPTVSERPTGRPLGMDASPSCFAVITRPASVGDYEVPVLFLAPWDEELALREGALYVCGEGCAQKLQSQFMGNVRESHEKKNSR